MRVQHTVSELPEERDDRQVSLTTTTTKSTPRLIRMNFKTPQS